MYLKTWSIFAAILLLTFLCSCENNMDVISTCPSVIQNDHRYQSSLQDTSIILEYVWIENDCLNLRLTYSGGCKDHLFELISPDLKTSNISTTKKNEMKLELYHINEDPCEALITQEYGFDISMFRSFAKEWRFSFTISRKTIEVSF